MSAPNDTPTKNTRRNLTGMSLGLNMAAGMAVFSGLGYFAGQKTGHEQTWTLAGIFVGLFYCGYEVWKIVRKTDT